MTELTFEQQSEHTKDQLLEVDTARCLVQGARIYLSMKC